MTSLAICDDVWPAPSRQQEPAPPMRRLAQVIAEVLTGARPAEQLSEVAAPDVIRQLMRGAGQLCAVPGKPSLRPIVGVVHVREPVPGVAEGCALINLGVRYRAIALRLEAPSGRWQCTALHVG